MSQVVELNIVDYKTILGWFERNFARDNNIPAQDRNTFTKLNAMMLSYLEDMKRFGEVK